MSWPNPQATHPYSFPASANSSKIMGQLILLNKHGLLLVLVLHKGNILGLDQILELVDLNKSLCHAFMEELDLLPDFSFVP
jgi:hypothetical protein